MINRISSTQSKRQKGFTLVEVIVVAVIVAILAGVSVPLYLGYINNSRVNQATNAAGSVASFANACVNAGGTLAAGAGADLGALVAGNTVVCTFPGTLDPTSLIIPSGVTVVVNTGAGTVVANPSEGNVEDASTTFSFTPIAEGGE